MAPVHAYSSSVTRASCLEQADKSSTGCLWRTGTRRCCHSRWSKCDPGHIGRSLSDEYDVDGPHTAYVSQVKEALIEQDEDIELEIALAALAQEGDRSGRNRCPGDAAGLQRITAVAGRAAGELWSRVRGVQRWCLLPVKRCFLQDSGRGKFCTGVADEVQSCGSSRACEGEVKVDCHWREWNSWPSCSVTCGEGKYKRSGIERGHRTRACPVSDGWEAKTSFLAYFWGRPQHVRLHWQRVWLTQDAHVSWLDITLSINGNRCSQEDGTWVRSGSSLLRPWPSVLATMRHGKPGLW